jgi:hypothetical protein
MTDTLGTGPARRTLLAQVPTLLPAAVMSTAAVGS